MRASRYAVQASVDGQGGPQAAIVGVAVGDDLQIVFDTLGDTRKMANLRRDARIALVFHDGDRTVQVEGKADEPVGEELLGAKALYFSVFPDGIDRQKWPRITWVRTRPSWIRVSDYTHAPPEIVEFDAAALSRLR